MTITSHKIIAFSLLFSFLSLSMTATAMPLPVIDTLVEYTPEPGAPPCRGVQVSENLIASSPLCVQKTRELSNYRSIDIHSLQGELIGEVAEVPDKNPDNAMLLRITLNTEHTHPLSYPVLYNSVSPPKEASVYNIDENQQLASQPVSLTSDETQDHPGFAISSEFTLPSGSPVFDNQNQLVCLSGHDNRCFTVGEITTALVRYKRELKDYPDDDDDGGLSTGAQAGILTGLIVGSIAIPTSIFYLVSYLRAHSAGMPAGTFWAGVLSLEYCGHCTTSTAMTAIIGTLVCPLTGAISCLVGYPISACLAVSNWVDSYSNSGSEQAPIFKQPSIGQPPPY